MQSEPVHIRIHKHTQQFRFKPMCLVRTLPVNKYVTIKTEERKTCERFTEFKQTILLSVNPQSFDDSKNIHESSEWGV